MTSERITIPARGGKAAFAPQGSRIAVINTHGNQVVDTWAFNADDLGEFMSMEHSRVSLLRLCAEVGESFRSNRRREILTILEDSSPGRHDMLMAACDKERYGLLGCTEYHDNCTDNLAAAMAELGLKEPETPSPLNLFMNIPWSPEGALGWGEPLSKPGDRIVLEAKMNLVVAFSACPQDLVPVNGKDMDPTEAHVEISGR